ncbi:SMP-30/gluconolactonase/LRE family protein [Sulfitobacter sp.]|uniref:SMP-30/gluconolactonase/LRE family protein n=1 Tax=Sulfitobacter sp. TaxID=1903071 RepID=UPI003001A1A7
MNNSFLNLAAIASVAMIGTMASSEALPFLEEIVVSNDAKLHIEGVDVAADGRIFVSSLLDSSVWVVSPDHQNITQFIEPGSLGMDSAVGLKVDERSGRLYVCSGPILGLSDFAAAAGPAGVLVFDLETGAPITRYDFPDSGFCNDVAFGPDGTLYATDSLHPRILRLPKNGDAMEVFIEDAALGGEGFALNGLGVHHNQLFFVKQNDGRMFSAEIQKDGTAGVLNEIELPRTLQSVDGVLMLDDGRALVVEGGRPGVTLFDPENAADTWQEFEVDGLDVPATAAFLPHGQVVIANTQNDVLTDPTAETDPFTLTIFQLPN